MADYVSFQPNLPSFGSDYLAQGFAGALALPNYFQNVDRQGELWKYAQEMQPLDKRSKELSNEQMSLANQGLQYGMSEKQVADVVNRALLANPDFPQMSVDSALAGLAAGRAESANKASTNQADAAYQIATYLENLPEPARRQFVEIAHGYTLPKEIRQALIEDPSKFKKAHEANAPYARQYGLESLQGMWGAKTASAGRDRPLPPMNMSQLEAALTQKIVAGVATPEMFEQLKQIRASKAAAAEKSLAGAENTVINAQKTYTELHREEERKVKKNQYNYNGKVVLGSELPPEVRRETARKQLADRGIIQPQAGQPQVSKPGIQTSKGGLEFTVKPRGNQ